MFDQTLNVQPIEDAVNELQVYVITGACFCKILGFYNGTGNSFTMKEFRHFPLKIPERVNRVIFRIQKVSELLLLKIPQKTKTCSNSTKIRL